MSKSGQKPPSVPRMSSSLFHFSSKTPRILWATCDFCEALSHLPAGAPLPIAILKIVFYDSVCVCVHWRNFQFHLIVSFTGMDLFIRLVPFHMLWLTIMRTPILPILIFLKFFLSSLHYFLNFVNSQRTNLRHGEVEMQNQQNNLLVSILTKSLVRCIYTRGVSE